jgi:hypothetical protein
MTDRARVNRAYKDFITVSRECEQKGWLPHSLQLEIEALHHKLDAALPSDNTSEADIREWV